MGKTYDISNKTDEKHETTLGSTELYQSSNKGFYLYSYLLIFNLVYKHGSINDAIPLLANIKMKKLLLISLLFLGSCFPSMQIGPDPHSIEFEETKFQAVVSYFESNPEIRGFEIDRAPNKIPAPILDEMENIGFLEFRNLGNFKVFFCGYGVVGKGWGFIHGDFKEEKINRPSLIKGNNNQLNLTYLEHLKGNWFRFGAE